MPALKIRAFSVRASFILPFALASWAAAQKYTLTDLGTLGGIESYATGISPTGQISGYSYSSSGPTIHAFVYSGGTMMDLGTLGGDTSYGLSINPSGQVAGFANTSGGVQHAFLYTN